MNNIDLHQHWLLKISEEYDDFFKKVDERIDIKQRQLKACKKRTELENKLAVEVKLKSELTRQLSELNHRVDDLEHVCAAFESRLTLTGTDKHRLEKAKESYQLAKELTGIRLDFRAPPNVVKGYIKNETQRLLVPFEVTDGEALWQLVTNTHHSGKENMAPNRC